MNCPVCCSKVKETCVATTCKYCGWDFGFVIPDIVSSVRIEFIDTLIAFGNCKGGAISFKKYKPLDEVEK